MIQRLYGPPALLLRRFAGLTDYRASWEAMRAFTDARDPDTPDELWLCEHPPVYTLGQAGRPEHLLDPRGIPIVHSDRGGQVTYHGPGQAIAYLLLDLRRARLGVRALVSLLEASVIALLAARGVTAAARPEAPGVYVYGAKIAALGLRVRNGLSYHGVALNVAMDLEPFRRINPCGYPGLQVIQMSDLVGPVDTSAIGEALAAEIAARLGLELHPSA